MSKLSEEDFLVLRRPLESRRQFPGSISGALLIGIFCQVVLLYLEYYISRYSIYPFAHDIFQLHLWFSIVLGVLSVIYAIPVIYKKFQRIQYLISIVVSQNIFALSPLILALIMIGAEIPLSSQNISLLIYLTYICLFIGLIVFVVTFVRFIILLQNGAYRIGSKKDQHRRKFETKSYVPYVIVGSTAFVFMLQFVMKNFELLSFDVVFFTTLLIIIFFVMLFVLPEQLVILYCKYRFDSFNFGPNGRHLYPVKDEHTNITSNKRINRL
ncbi:MULTISPECIES: hypothetical protein [Bacillaceae]|uniref:ABC transporter ATPase n=1 Tax=Evansella alkalicola TaxID=745819 RepID=A0ABS6JY13_9BACI|nr:MULTISPECIES: hypothetical protein [Bacillaceae]MBU9723489.1 hypothetical protein [Bacillus alkalicola]